MFTSEELSLMANEPQKGTDLMKTIEDIQRMCENARAALQANFFHFKKSLKEEVTKRVSVAGKNKTMQQEIYDKGQAALEKRSAEVREQMDAISYHEWNLTRSAMRHYGVNLNAA